MTVLWISLILFVLYFLAETVWGLTAYKRIVEGILTGRIKRISLYGQLMIGLWMPALAVLALAAFKQFGWGDIGLVWFRPHEASWLVVASAVLAGLYFCYLLLSLYSLRQNSLKKDGVVTRVPGRIRAMFPVTAVEKRMWACTAVSAGFCEELLFRGFLFCALGTLFPALPVAAVLVIATVLFGIGHLYQGPAEALQPMVLGLLYGVFYIAFGTLLPCMLLHALQDLCAVYVLGRQAAERVVEPHPSGIE